MDVIPYLDRLRSYVEERGFAGYDPYDALNSPILRQLTFGRNWARILAIQALRRAPFNPRPLLLVRAGQNPKALGLFLEGYARLYRLEPRQEYADRAAYLIGRLAALSTRTPSGHGWGYNFDWQSRAFFVPRFTPTIVCSSFVVHALLDASEVFGSQQACELALPVADFFLRDLHRVPAGDSFCFSYTAVDRYPVHNASLLGASVLIRLYRLTGNLAVRDAALTALAYSMRHQREDGSWYYSESETAHWIDSFHTGFNLEAVRRFLNAGEGSEYTQAYARAVRFYAERFFLPDGTPKYYAGSTYPIDVHSAAEAISYFADEGTQFRPLVDRVLRWTLENLADDRGFFYYQKGPHLTKRIPYMRWGQAWMFRALTAWAARTPVETTAEICDARNSGSPVRAPVYASGRSSV